MNEGIIEVNGVGDNGKIVFRECDEESCIM